MYSMVLMVALSSSPDAAACGKAMGCLGSCSGAPVASCQGCHGGGLFSGLGGHKNGCGGCHGESTGCGGVVTGCGGCQGGHGLFGGCHGGGLFRKHKHGCNGESAGCHGSSTGCYGSSTGCIGTPGVIIGTPVEVVQPMKIEEKKKTGGVTMVPAPATIIVNVPADAKVTIDGAATISTSTVRHYATPVLVPGSVNYYTFTATIVRDGKEYTSTERVAVTAGQKPTITLNPNVGSAFASK